MTSAKRRSEASLTPVWPFPGPLRDPSNPPIYFLTPCAYLSWEELRGLWIRRRFSATLALSAWTESLSCTLR